MIRTIHIGTDDPVRVEVDLAQFPHLTSCTHAEACKWIIARADVLEADEHGLLRWAGIVGRTLTRIHEAEKAGLGQSHAVVLGLLTGDRYVPGGRISQRAIAISEPWLGCHPEHETNVVRNEFESTLRKVRQIIRDLRIIHKIPVLSDSDGYFLPSTQEEADEYLKRVESEARARAASSLETYRAMRDMLTDGNKFFDAIETT